MTTYYIFRHGDTEDSGSLFAWIFGHKTNNSRGIDILPKALPALGKLGLYLKNVKIDVAYSSPYPRCVNSAKIVGDPSNIKFKKDDRLRELERNGEKIASFKTRVESFISELESKKYASVAICTHGAVIGALKHLITTGKFHPLNIRDYSPPGNLIIITDKKIKVINFN